ncbi:MAG: glutathione S-transferase family protein [Pseudomonadota bacterium]
MNTLVIYPAVFGEPSASPFCVKALCMLKAAGIDYEVEETADPRKAPKSKLPVLQTDEEIIADSDQIRSYLERKTGVDFDEGLSNTDRATSRAVIRMVEEHIYFAIVCDRWGNDENWAHVKQAFFSEIPFPVRGLITGQVRKQALASLNGQGMGRHSDAERFERVQKDIVAIRSLVGDTPFLFGEEPTAADMSVVAMLSAVVATPVETDTSRFVRNDNALSDYMKRGRERLYPETAP